MCVCARECVLFQNNIILRDWPGPVSQSVAFDRNRCTWCTCMRVRVRVCCALGIVHGPLGLTRSQCFHSGQPHTQAHTAHTRKPFVRTVRRTRTCICIIDGDDHRADDADDANAADDNDSVSCPHAPPLTALMQRAIHAADDEEHC